jgi:hypothetical protein
MSVPRYHTRNLLCDLRPIGLLVGGTTLLFLQLQYPFAVRFLRFPWSPLNSAFYLACLAAPWVGVVQCFLHRRRWPIVIAAVAVLPLLFISLIGWQPLTRPPSVSPQARFVVTMKSTAWYDCSVDRTREVDLCRAWDDGGRLIAQGKFRLDGENRAATAAELRPSMVQLYPGHPELAWIYLSGGMGNFSKTLVPVNDSGQPLERFEVHVEPGK